MTETAIPFEGLIQAFRIQAATCDGMGSPFPGAMLSAMADDLAAGGPTAGLMRRWSITTARAALTDATPIRLLGALHDLALSGEEPALAAAYPAVGRPGDASAAWRAASAAIVAHDQRLSHFLDHEPQTNEVRRSACLLPGFLTIAAETRLPIRAFEVGASAGLNQSFDRFGYTFGDAGSWGPPGARVHIPAGWTGDPPPLDAPLEVIERAACDRKPVDLNDAQARQRLRAYVWADQLDRLERLDAAIALARDSGIVVETADAVAWARRITLHDDVVTVLFHSVFWQYMPAESQAELAATIAELGGGATAKSPFAWLRMEPPPNNLAIMELRLTLWPAGGDVCLGTVHPHGAWVAWGGQRRFSALD